MHVTLITKFRQPVTRAGCLVKQLKRFIGPDSDSDGISTLTSFQDKMPATTVTAVPATALKRKQRDQEQESDDEGSDVVSPVP